MGRSRRSRKKMKSPSKSWAEFKKTDRYKVVAFICRVSWRLITKVGDHPEAEAALRAKAGKAKAAAGTRGKSWWEQLQGWGHDAIDDYELHTGNLTDEEDDAYKRMVEDRHPDMPFDDAFRVWVHLMHDGRRQRRKGTVQVMGGHGGSSFGSGSQAPNTPAPAGHPGWNGPRPAPTSPRRNVRPRPATPRKVNRAAQLRNAWDVKFDKLKGQSMADGTLKGALATLRTFAETPVEDRQALHAHLAEFAAFGEELGDIVALFAATLEAARADGSPGVPKSVTTHLSPIGDHGAAIGQCCQDTANAFEDRFAEAIRVAADEEKPSDDFLRAPAG